MKVGVLIIFKAVIHGAWGSDQVSDTIHDL